MKPDTENIYQRKINQVIDYINANLHLPLRLDIIARASKRVRAAATTYYERSLE